MNPQQAATEPVSHEEFTELLQEHVDDRGFVNYEELNDDREDLKEYLKILSSNAPNDSNWSDEDQMAYWINVYNAFTIELILQYYPIESIKDIGSTVQVPFVNTPWDIRFIEIAGEKYDLNNIEHNILRKNWQEPRIHFAVNCASFSCPRLRREAYEGAKLNEQLEDQARKFVNNAELNGLSSEEASVSRIFDWYKSDFTRNGTLIEYLNQYAREKLEPDAAINFKEYDWSLNEQK